MFYVRSARALPSQALVRPSLRAPLAPPPPHALPPPQPAPRHRIVCPPSDSAGRVGVQPAAELGHIQRHGHGLHVLRALRPCPAHNLRSGRALPPVPCPQSTVEPSHARCVRRAVARRPPPPGPHLVPHRMPSFRFSAGHVGFQPAAELRHVEGHGNVGHVLRALRACPAPQPSQSVPPRACHARPPPAARTSSRIACALLSTRQGAWAFNQPLSFDTSSVTYMNNMFVVRSAPTLPPQALVRPSLCALLALPRPHALPPPGPPPRRASNALLSTRQDAYAFNQPLSFDTSSVADMRNMLSVRSTRVPCPPSL